MNTKIRLMKKGAFTQYSIRNISFISIILICLSSIPAEGKSGEPKGSMPLLTATAQSEDSISDPNHDVNCMIERATDTQFNDSSTGYCVAGIFTRSLIGIDMFKAKPVTATFPTVMRGIGIEGGAVKLKRSPKERPVKIRGMKFRDIQFYSYTGNTHLATPADIRRKFCPDAQGPYLYMINKFFLMHDEDLYRIDPDFIQSIETFPSTDINLLRGEKPFTVIRIFTKTPHNIFVPHIN